MEPKRRSFVWIMRLVIGLVLVIGSSSILVTWAADAASTLIYRSVSIADADPTVIYRGVSTAVQFDVSPPLTELAQQPPTVESSRQRDKENDRATGLEGPLGPQDVDPLMQREAGAGEIPTPSVNFDTLNANCGGCVPPDPVGVVGPNHYVVMGNAQYAVYNKTGTLLAGPANINTLWSGFGGACQNENAGDPVVFYDQLADRWILTQFTIAGPTYFNCVAISQTANPTGAYFRYAFSTGGNFPDYPKYGHWSDAYYISTREFLGSGGPFQGVGAYAMNRAQLIAGNPTPQIISFLVMPGATPYRIGDGLLPSALDGSTLPPAGTPNFYIGSQDNGGPYGAPSDALNIWKFHVDFATPANSTLTLANTVAVAAFDSIFPCAPGIRDCIPQPGTSQKLDHQGYRQRVLHRAAYRNFGTHEAIVTNQSVEAAAGISGIRWWEIRSPNSSPTIFQEGTYAPADGVHRWMGSIAQDRQGNMALGFSASNATTVFPSARYTGRLVGDALGTMSQGEGAFINGLGSQTGSTRWGDYTAMTVDPVDDCTFWYVNEYYPATSAASWRLRVGAFKFASCSGRTLTVASSNPNSGVAITVSPPDKNGQGNGTTQFTRSYNNNTAVTLTAPATAGGNAFSSWSGCDSPAGTTCNMTMSADKTVTAIYAPPPPHTLIVASSNPNSGVAITVSPPDKNGQGNGTTQFTRSYNNNTAVTLTAPATAGGNTFSSWSGCDSPAGTTCNVTMSTNKSVTAIYVSPTTHTLTVASFNPNSGAAITVSPTDKNGQGNGTTFFTRTYNHNTALTLTAPATAGGNAFSGWSGCDSPAGTTCNVTMSTNKSVTAIFGAIDPQPFDGTWSGTTSQVGIGLADPTNIGKPKTISFTVVNNAITSISLEFVTFPGTCTVEGFTTGPFNPPKGITGNMFSFTSAGILSFTITGTFSSGTSASGDLQFSFAQGSCQGSATATWTAINTTPPPPHTLTVASSNPNSGVAITVSPPDNNGQGNGTTQFTRTYNHNTSVTLTAPATAGGNAFQKWQCNGVDSTNPNKTITMTADSTCTAVYGNPFPQSSCLWGLYIDDHQSGGGWESRLILANLDTQQAHTYEVFVLTTDTIRFKSLSIAPSGLAVFTCDQLLACGAAGWLYVQSDAPVFAATLFVINNIFGGGAFTAQTPLCLFGLP